MIGQYHQPFGRGAGKSNLHGAEGDAFRRINVIRMLGILTHRRDQADFRSPTVHKQPASFLWLSIIVLKEAFAGLPSFCIQILAGTIFSILIEQQFTSYVKLKILLPYTEKCVFRPSFQTDAEDAIIHIKPRLTALSSPGGAFWYGIMLLFPQQITIYRCGGALSRARLQHRVHLIGRAPVFCSGSSPRP